MNNEMKKDLVIYELAQTLQKMSNNQALVAAFGVIFGSVLTGMGISTNEELNRRHEDFNNNVKTAITNTLTDDNLPESPEDFSDLQQLILHVTDLALEATPATEVHISWEGKDDE